MRNERSFCLISNILRGANNAPYSVALSTEVGRFELAVGSFCSGCNLPVGAMNAQTDKRKTESERSLFEKLAGWQSGGGKVVGK